MTVVDVKSAHDFGARELPMPQETGRSARYASDTIELVVRSVVQEAEGILSLVLGRPDGAPLPTWEPGAHIDLILGEDLVRQYSLCGDPGDQSVWRLGILRESGSRGGSEFIHTKVTIGSRLAARGPRNNFALARAKAYLFIAGGIGITPFLPMIAAADAARADWKLLYGGRTITSMAFLNDLRSYGGRVMLQPQDQHGLLDIDAFLSLARGKTELYCCGPEPLIAAVEAASASHDSISLHVEHFAARQVDGAAAEGAFEVECNSSGITLQVPSGKSILEVARAAGINLLSSCSEGVCGTCETDVIEGIPDHRDAILTAEERASNKSMMVCVSRCIGRKLVLDL